MKNTNTNNQDNAPSTQDASFTTGLDNINSAIHNQPLKENDSQANERLWKNIMNDFEEVYPPIDEKGRQKIAASREDIEDVAIV
ncbi:hypothetical protein [Sporomusa sp. KB1]|jgi:hypothetical protein|uniref:hypothetical protein n=1 Tax=Sporomusa sp. KB1 TaxID=943346 RepID=UPI0011A906CA|nr:hypothetical protein [Sporomusa sp. KB1]TWH48680.1 hypothetical protein Salpa_4849 [Sporomusa sp. KB1]